jgi:hypothetical protein
VLTRVLGSQEEAIDAFIVRRSPFQSVDFARQSTL